VDNCGYKHYKRLMVDFGIVVRVFLGLDEPFQVASLQLNLKLIPERASSADTETRAFAAVVVLPR
jgi:hypothetical protein